MRPSLWVPDDWQSPPSRGRGLKPVNRQPGDYQEQVASFTGAWIETVCKPRTYSVHAVASFTGAWIETGRGDSGRRQIYRRLLHGGVD